MVLIPNADFIRVGQTKPCCLLSIMSSISLFRDIKKCLLLISNNINNNNNTQREKQGGIPVRVWPVSEATFHLFDFEATSVALWSTSLGVRESDHPCLRSMLGRRRETPLSLRLSATPGLWNSSPMSLEDQRRSCLHAFYCREVMRSDLIRLLLSKSSSCDFGFGHTCLSS